MSKPGKLREQAEDRVLVHYDTRLPHLSRWQRMQIPMIAWGVLAAMRTPGPTLRFEVFGGQKVGRDYRPDQPPKV